MKPTRLIIPFAFAVLAIAPSFTMGQTREGLSSRRIHAQKPAHPETKTKHRNRRGSKTFTKVPVKKPVVNQPVIYPRNVLDPAIVRLAIENRAQATARRQVANPPFGSPAFGPSNGNGAVNPTPGTRSTRPANPKTISAGNLPTSRKPVAPMIVKSPFAKFNDTVKHPIQRSATNKTVIETVTNPYVVESPERPNGIYFVKDPNEN